MTEKRVTCAVMLRDGRALLARRAPGQKNAGCWEFPGGKVEAGESDRDCLEREIWEELGVKGRAGAHLCDSVYEYSALDTRIRLCAYLFEPENERFALRVHDALAYFDAEALARAELSAADVPIAQRVRELLK